ncbi:MAG: PEGA domain-containing protein [Candidatus Krumholzibacteriia bacterium]
MILAPLFALVRPGGRRRIVVAAVCAGLLGALPCAAGAAALVDIQGPPLARLTLDGQDLGILPLDRPVPLPPGRYRLEATLPGHRPFRESVRVLATDQVIHLRVRLTPLSRTAAVTSNLLLAGLGQHYLGARTRGYAYNVVEIGGLVAALAGEMARRNHRDDYLLLQSAYESAVDADEIARLRAESGVAYRDLQDAEDRRDLGLAVAAGAVVVSMLDALLFFPDGGDAPQAVPPAPEPGGVALITPAEGGIGLQVTLGW